MDVTIAKIDGFDEYTIDTLGRVYSTKTSRYRKPSITRLGYKSVDLYQNGKMKRFLIHRLVAQAFIPNPLNLPQVNHIDENPSNNEVTNLEWCTAKYNMNYGNGAKTRHLKIDYTRPIYKKVARENGRKTAVKIEQYTKDGKLIAVYDSIRDAEKALGTKQSKISSCALGKRKSSNGFVWKHRREG